MEEAGEGREGGGVDVTHEGEGDVPAVREEARHLPAGGGLRTLSRSRYSFTTLSLPSSPVLEKRMAAG